MTYSPHPLRTFALDAATFLAAALVLRRQGGRCGRGFPRTVRGVGGCCPVAAHQCPVAPQRPRLFDVDGFDVGGVSERAVPPKGRVPGDPARVGRQQHTPGALRDLLWAGGQHLLDGAEPGVVQPDGRSGRLSLTWLLAPGSAGDPVEVACPRGHCVRWLPRHPQRGRGSPLPRPSGVRVGGGLRGGVQRGLCRAHQIAVFRGERETSTHTVAPTSNATTTHTAEGHHHQVTATVLVARFPSNAKAGANNTTDTADNLPRPALTRTGSPPSTDHCDRVAQGDRLVTDRCACFCVPLARS
ncbi:hypothetical protein CLV40_1332 [Actinokineospora auranticolor]|uniref:Uncharacterized protein n=1 Tax=Actinokineospora auranticolor TaxID=155976 RepID=A0A2S6GCZ1_9PSEU|nr:hypothetical protein CLV40_1332 [Actinokineospora auranticolor]